MATKTITPAIRDRADRLVEEVSGWLRGTSRRNGRSFLIVPASNGSAAWYVSFEACTCPGFRNRSVCAHNEAVKIAERRRMTELAAEAAWQAENDELFAGFERIEVEAAPALPVAAPVARFSRGYSELFEDNTDAF